ncbi:MAG: hypothetical protein R3275_12405, partial [Saprospiraceae bacterium]|nr:hypothetical protein [Saprospiraceae bacterium]
MRKVFWLFAFTLLGMASPEAQVFLTGDFVLEISDNEGRVIENAKVDLVKKRGHTYIIFQEETDNGKTDVLVSESGIIQFQRQRVEDNRLISQFFSGRTNGNDLIEGQHTIYIDGQLDENLSGHFNLIRNVIRTGSPDKVGAHLGIVHGLFTFQNGNVSGILDETYQYSVGFPMGITVHRTNFSFDLEMVAFISPDSDSESALDADRVSLMLHPGLLWGLRDGMTFGTRLAFELGDRGRYGFTPLLNFGNIVPNGFVEVVLPVR